MRSKREYLKKSKLYLILDAQVNSPEEIIECAQQGALAGIDIFQLRAKNLDEERVADLVDQLKHIIDNKSLFILNDNVYLARTLDVDGVHIGQDDMTLDEARELMGDKIIGVSCQTFGQALLADAEGADYIGFGSVFKTRTKPDRRPMNLGLLKNVLHTVSIPVFPIGGIAQDNIMPLYDLGVRRYAVCRSVCQAKDKVASIKGLLDYCG